VIEVSPAYETAVKAKHYLWCTPLEGYSAAEYYCLPQESSRQSVEILKVFPSYASTERDKYGNLVLHAPHCSNPFVGSESTVKCWLEVAEVREPPVEPLAARDSNEEERPFLQKSPLIECENSEILSLSGTITERVANCFEAAVNIVSWVFSNVRFQSTELESFPSAKWILEHRIGTCGDLSRLAVAMMRSYGLPARIVVGTLASPMGMTSHGWGEFYLSGIGWVPFEPTLGYVGWIDANHTKVAAIPDETYMKSWFKASAVCTSRQVEPPRLVELKGACLQSNSTGQHQLRLELENRTNHYLSTRVIITKDKAVFRDGKMEAFYDDILYLPPEFNKDICLNIGTASTYRTALIINLFLGAYYKLELREGEAMLNEIPKQKYACSRSYESKNRPPWIDDF